MKRRRVLNAQNFGQCHTLTVWSTWRCHSSVRIVRQVQKIGQRLYGFFCLLKIEAYHLSGLYCKQEPVSFNLLFVKLQINGHWDCWGGPLYTSNGSLHSSFLLATQNWVTEYKQTRGVTKKEKVHKKPSFLQGNHSWKLHTKGNHLIMWPFIWNTYVL